MADLLTVDEALACVLGRARLLPEEPVRVAAADGRILREPARAVVDLPPFASSAMDGFAVRAADTPGELPVAFRIAAGDSGHAALETGTAAGIATGASVPDSADAVVPVELVSDLGDRVVISAAVEPGQHIRLRGGDVCAGDTVVEAGVRLGPAQLGGLAAAGVAEVTCSVRPRVALVATGSELRVAGDELEPGQIFESNRAMVAAALSRTGAVVDALPIVADSEDAHRVAIDRGLEADVLVTSGGVSMGPHDLVRRVEAELGVEEVFWGVSVKPGKPLSFGIRGDTLVFGLPGNPVSSLVGTLLFVAPALLARQGAKQPGPLYAYGRIHAPIRRNLHRDELVRAQRAAVDDEVVLQPIAGQDSHMVVRAASAQALVFVPRGEGEIPADASVRYLPLD